MVKVRVGLGCMLACLLTMLFLVATDGAARAASAPSTPWTWGGNSYGELGTGGTAPRLTAAAVGLDNVIDLHGGREHVVALRGDGTVWTWGSNQHGQLGTGGTANRSTPAQVPGLSNIVAVETGHNHSMALGADGRAWSWGYNADGQLGDGTTILRRTPVLVSGVNDAIAIVAGRDMAYAIRANHTVVGWGRNDEGQVGDGTTARRLTPVAVQGLTGVVQISGGRDHALAVRTDGSVWAWGSNDYGQLGLGNAGASTDRLLPAQVLASGVAEVAAGAHHSYARNVDGTVSSWGRNYRSNLGDGTTTQRTRPVAVRGVAGAVSIGSGRDHGLAVLGDGRVMAWGENGAGQLGDGTTVDRPLAIVVPGVQNAVLAGGGGAEYSVVLVADAQVPNAPPVARASAACDGTDCTFSGAMSTDSDGQIVNWAWAFDDGGSASGVQVQRQLALGPHQATLTVTDNDGATASTTIDFEVDPPTTGTEVSFVGASSQNANTTQTAVVVPAAVQVGDRLLMVVTVNRAGTITVPTGWSNLGEVSDGTDVRSWVLTRAAQAGVAGSTVRVGLDAYSKVVTHLVAYRDAGLPVVTGRAEPGSTAVHAAPAASVSTAGSAALWFWADKVSAPHGWTLPVPLTSRGATQGSGGGLLTSVAGDRLALPAGPLAAVSADAGIVASKAISWTIVVPPTP
ncbi:PKD domain-containing protein [Nocardioides sp. Bht2]|uniref:RCC1 domain-containing protein n=1 Tax=Nocardioides sp. Bht2 TaxID=3392297 RepID=UPI0039B38B67